MNNDKTSIVIHRYQKIMLNKNINTYLKYQEANFCYCLWDLYRISSQLNCIISKNNGKSNLNSK